VLIIPKHFYSQPKTGFSSLAYFGLIVENGENYGEKSRLKIRKGINIF
jgi:hypothetical protein